MQTTVKVMFEKNIQNNKTFLHFWSVVYKNNCRKIILQQNLLKNVYHTALREFKYYIHNMPIII